MCLHTAKEIICVERHLGEVLRNHNRDVWIVEWVEYSHEAFYENEINFKTKTNYFSNQSDSFVCIFQFDMIIITEIVSIKAWHPIEFKEAFDLKISPNTTRRPRFHTYSFKKICPTSQTYPHVTFQVRITRKRSLKC